MGAPDYTKTVKLMAWDGKKMVPVTVGPDGQLYALFKGYDGTEYRPVKVDADGNIIAVIKGQYGDTLKTVGVDDKGRITVFLCDAKDVWGNVVVVGNAELAARLGSPKTYDRRGEVIFISTFEEGLPPFVPIIVTDGSKIQLSTYASRSGAYSVKCVTAASIGAEAGVRKRMSFLKFSKIGVEFTFTETTVDHYTALLLEIYDGSYKHTASIRYDEKNLRLIWYDSAGNWQLLKDQVSLSTADKVFHSMKLVIDPTTGKYVRGMCDSYEIDMADKEYSQPASTEAPYICASVSYIANIAESLTGYIDSLIITQNEP